jgi:hypothetical protein
MGMFQALWGLNFRSFNHLNGPVMVLLHKTQSPAGLKDYGPISLIHSVGKLFSRSTNRCRICQHSEVFFSHNKSANSTFRHSLSIKQTEYRLMGSTDTRVLIPARPDLDVFFVNSLFALRKIRTLPRW